MKLRSNRGFPDRIAFVVCVALLLVLFDIGFYLWWRDWAWGNQPFQAPPPSASMVSRPLPFPPPDATFWTKLERISPIGAATHRETDPDDPFPERLWDANIDMQPHNEFTGTPVSTNYLSSPRSWRRLIR